MSPSNVREMRSALVEFLRRDLVGPPGDEVEVLSEEPSLRYSAGVLFPAAQQILESAEVSGSGDGEDSGPVADPIDVVTTPESGRVQLSGEAGTEDAHDDTITLANAYKPAAMGLSFLVAAEATSLRVVATAARYESTVVEIDNRRESRYTRVPLGLEPFEFSLPSDRISKRDVLLARGLNLRCVVRPSASGARVVTVSIYNPGRGVAAGKFFQAGFTVSAPDGSPVFLEYGMSDATARDAEELNLAMLYRERRVFAVGHGCAPEWDAGDAQRATSVSTVVLPTCEIPPLLPTEGGDCFLNMEFLSTAGRQEVLAELRDFCGSYSSWIAAAEQRAPRLEVAFQQSAAANLKHCRRACARMEQGVEVLGDNELAFEAFVRVNRAMLQQQHHVRRGRRLLTEAWEPLPTEYRSIWSDSKRMGFWRKFQLAFLLMNIPAFVPGESVLTLGEDRIDTHSLVDLIWFPTGGGKTEAYLGVAAFVIFMRRLQNPENAGCSVLMRYTLRLLTTQQFQRATSLLAACELQRRAEPKRLGPTPLSAGLWAGKSLTPNLEKDAKASLNALAKGSADAKNPFQLLSCPWCGTQLDGQQALGYRMESGRLVYVCPAGPRQTKGAAPCPFSADGQGLPICVVDESIYRQPPTLIIGTVDKFAMLAWRGEARSLFGQPPNEPPDLIIQDELHLISGPLGSMVGLYEGLIDFLATNPRTDRRPKIIASTATIRRAGVQCRALYDREMFQFPPQGLEISDAFFAEEQRERSGRLYVGFLPTAASSPLTAQVRLVSALTQGPMLVAPSVDAVELIDPYWTLIQYFSSLKELGRAATLVSQDIPEYMKAMHRRCEVSAERKRWIDSAEELTSRKREDEIPKVLGDLQTRYTPGAAMGAQALDTVLATNMISVGMDVDRLGLMLVVTQPKGTSEYIQATSRVGRSSAAPGLVLTLYNASRPRDRSHYEKFRAYHGAFYRFVEPTSVTPFAIAAMERAVHAVLVIAARQVAGLDAPDDFRPGEDERIEAALQFLRQRVASIDPEHRERFDMLLTERQREWGEWQPGEWGDFGIQEQHALMYPAGTLPTTAYEEASWATPTSMRNVDVECVGRVRVYPQTGAGDGEA